MNKNNLLKLKNKIFGQNSDGVIHYAGIYFILILTGFVFLYPIIYMISYSFMDTKDLINPLVKWIPTKLYWGNFKEAVNVLNYFSSLKDTLVVTIIPAIIQTISTSIIGYGFAKFKFPGKNIIFAIAIGTFIIPPQITMIPQFLMYKDLGLIGSVFSYILPATFGQGMRSAIFILIFYQFFSMLPKSLEEAAQIDGAGYFTTFVKIAVPSVIPAFIISFLFSFVWYWNETTLAALYFGDTIKTLPLQLQNFAASFQKLHAADPNSQTGKSINEAINMAGTFLNILPLILVYFFTQKWFVESFDRAGITGE